MRSLLLNGIYLPLFMMADEGGGGAATGGVQESAATGLFSLADLAGLNTDDVKVLLSRIPPAGIFHVTGKSVALKEAEAVEGKDRMFRLGYQYTVMSAKPIDKTIDPESLVDRVLTESFPLYASNMGEGIGLLKGRHQLVGLPNSGMGLGGVEGQEPGWLDTSVGAEFDIRVRHGITNGQERAYYDWLKPEAPAEAAS